MARLEAQSSGDSGKAQPQAFHPDDAHLEEWKPRYDDLESRLNSCADEARAAQILEEALAFLQDTLCGGGHSKTFAYNCCAWLLASKGPCRDIIRDTIWEFVAFRTKIVKGSERSILCIAVFELIVEDPPIVEDLRLFLDMLHQSKTSWAVEHAYRDRPEKLFEHLFLLGIISN